MTSSSDMCNFTWSVVCQTHAQDHIMEGKGCDFINQYDINFLKNDKTINDVMCIHIGI